VKEAWGPSVENPIIFNLRHGRDVYTKRLC
jgi:hypothetical protein